MFLIKIHILIKISWFCYWNNKIKVILYEVNIVTKIMLDFISNFNSLYDFIWCLIDIIIYNLLIDLIYFDLLIFKVWIVVKCNNYLLDTLLKEGNLYLTGTCTWQARTLNI